MMRHDLIKHGRAQYECRLCVQTWSRKPGANCPGVKVYPRYGYEPLMTKGQLGYYGYQTAEKALPAPAGCYYLPALGDYVLLYDPAQAVKKYEQPRPRTRILVTEIHWPVKLLPLIESFHEYSQSLWDHSQPLYTDRMNEIANTIGIMLTFTPDELECLAGDIVTFCITPSFARRCYPSSDINGKEQRDLVSSFVAAYERCKANL
jgi:hypothetical protein